MQTDPKGMVRIGRISSLSGNTARVFYPDMENMLSGDLIILRRPVESADQMKTDWYPCIGQMVLCLYLPMEDADGYILGGL